MPGQDVSWLRATTKPAVPGDLSGPLWLELLKEQPVFAYKFNGTRFDCGDKAGFLKANVAFALEHPEIKDTLREYIKNIVLEK